jgi:hypothetical protein
MTMPIRSGVVTVPIYKSSSSPNFPGWYSWVIFPGTVVFECFCPDFQVEEGEVAIRLSYLSPPMAVPEDSIAW